MYKTSLQCIKLSIAENVTVHALLQCVIEFIIQP